MKLLQYFLVSGHAWFACGSFYLLACALDAFRVFDPRPRARRIVHFTLVLAIPLAILSGTPLPLVGGLLLALCCCLHAGLGFTSVHLGLRRAGALASGCLVLWGLIHELPYYVAGSPPDGPQPRRVYILGDSLTAGGFGERLTWPRLLASTSTAELIDLSHDGDTTGTVNAAALLQDTRPGSWVFVELGGNDMLGGATADEFESNLDGLLAIARGTPRSPRTVIMMELPVVVPQWRFGAIQRRLAERHRVVLVPKRVLAGIVLWPGNALAQDLHLTQAGQESFAAAIRPWLNLP